MTRSVSGIAKREYILTTTCPSEAGGKVGPKIFIMPHTINGDRKYNASIR